MKVDEQLLGAWRLLGPDGQPDAQAVIEVEFRSDGMLHHVVCIGAARHLTALHYRLDGDLICSDAPDGSAQHRTRFALEADGRLRLEGPESTTWYARVPTSTTTGTD